MSLSPLLIAPITHGLQTDLQPWIAPKDSFPVLENLHVEHGFLERRNGYRQFGNTLDNASPVIGLEQYIETADGVKTLLAFDTTSAYSYSTTTQTFSQLTPATIMSASKSDYISGANWYSTFTGGSSSIANRFYFTNGLKWNGAADPNSTNGIRYFDGSTTTTLFTPSNGTDSIYGCKFIFSLGQRLILLYTFEGASNSYPQRARWCAKQNPGDGSGMTTNGWDDTVAGRGDYADAATSDQIISAQLLQNQIIVFFTDSVWTLLPTPDPAKAFRWQRINNFRSCGGRKASVQFDRYIAAVGDRGITATDGSNTSRVDDGITNYVTDYIAPKNFNQVFCARDFSNKRWWSLYPSQPDSNNDSALIYDDDSGSYSTYKIALNCLGYGFSGFDYQIQDFTAANGFYDPDGNNIRIIDFDLDDTISSYYYQENEQLFLGGGFTGEVFLLDTGNYDIDTAIISNFLTAAWNPFNDQGTEALLSYVDFFVDADVYTIGIVSFYKDTEFTPYSTSSFDFLPDLDYICGIQNVSLTNPCSIQAFNHGLSTGDQIYIYLVTGTSQVNSINKSTFYTVTVVDSDNFTLDGIDATGFSAYTGSGGLYRRQFYQTKTWKRVFSGGIGWWHQIGFSATGINKPFRIHAIKPYFKSIGNRTINQ